MKKIICLIITIMVLIIPLNTFALEYPTLHYKNAIVYDTTDKKILYELNSEEISSIASLTKIMTIITAIEKNNDPTKTITYNQNMKNNVAWYASVAGFKVGDKLTFDDLLYAAMLPSGADATVALAITTSGSLDAFIIEMNSLAKKIGMNNTNFVNVHGLDEENHYSTAKDIQILLEYSLQNSKFKEVYTTKEYTLSTGKKIKSTVKKQSDKFNLDISKIIGSKTGFTGNAGLCISTIMNHKNHEIIFITLNAPTTSTSVPYNISDTLDLINFIENNYNNQQIIKKNQFEKDIEVLNSKIETYKIKSTKEISLFLENDYNKEDIKIVYTGTETLSYKNKKGEKLGTIKYYYKEEEIASEQIYLNQELEIDYLKVIKSNKWIVVTALSSIIIITSILIILVKKIKTNKHKKRTL